MNYLVSGGAGFIGSHLVRVLHEQGANVRVLDNFSSGKPDNLKGLDVEIVRGDLRDASWVTKAVAGGNIIFHEGALVSAPELIGKTPECFDVNVTGTSILFEGSREG